MNAVANIFDVNSDGFIDYYEFVSALHPSRDPYRRTLDADQINEEVWTPRAHCTTHPCGGSRNVTLHLLHSRPDLGESPGISV